MRIGCVGSVDDAEAMAGAGFDYLEVNIQKVLRGDVDDAQWAAEAPNPDAVALPMEAGAMLVPGSYPIIGSKRDTSLLTTYMKRVAERADRLGVRRLVFGSGGARKRPDGLDPTIAAQHLEWFARMAGEACAKHDVIVVIEHLNKGETNTLNRLAEARELAERVGMSSVQLLVDSYHYGVEDESDADLLTLGNWIQHVHVAEPIQRLQPGGHGHGSVNAYDFEHFFSLLRKVGYDQGISVEAKWTGEISELGPGVVKLIRDAWSAAGTWEDAAN